MKTHILNFHGITSRVLCHFSQHMVISNQSPINNNNNRKNGNTLRRGQNPADDQDENNFNANVILDSLIESQFNSNRNDIIIPHYIYQLFQFKCHKIKSLEINLVDFTRLFLI